LKFGKENLYWKTVRPIFGLFSKFCEVPTSGSSVRPVTSLSDAQIVVCNHSSDFDGIAMIPLLHTSKMILLVGLGC
jgi:1-acyl-sn-glycerol-3-phosphate acyltransferase